MRDARYPIREPTTTQDWRAAWHDLAEALGTDEAMLIAIASGDVDAEGIAANHPGCGMWFLPPYDDYTETHREVADAGGREAWQDREFRSGRSPRLQSRVS